MTAAEKGAQQVVTIAGILAEHRIAPASLAWLSYMGPAGVQVQIRRRFDLDKAAALPLLRRRHWSEPYAVDEYGRGQIRLTGVYGTGRGRIVVAFFGPERDDLGVPDFIVRAPAIERAVAS